MHADRATIYLKPGRVHRVDVQADDTVYAANAADGSTIAAASNSIQMGPGKAYVAPLNALSIPAGERLMTMQSTGALVARG